jgi:hypothetical protein
MSLTSQPSALMASSQSSFDFSPFSSNVNLTARENEFCSSVCELIINDYDIYKWAIEKYEQSMMKKIDNMNGTYCPPEKKFDAIRCAKGYLNIINGKKSFILGQINQMPYFRINFPETFNNISSFRPIIRRQIACLLVNHFLDSNEHEIKKILHIDQEESDAEQ